MTITPILRIRAGKVLRRFRRGDAVVRDGGMTETRAIAMQTMLEKPDLPDDEVKTLVHWIERAEGPYGYDSDG